MTQEDAIKVAEQAAENVCAAGLAYLLALKALEEALAQIAAQLVIDRARENH